MIASPAELVQINNQPHISSDLFTEERLKDDGSDGGMHQEQENKGSGHCSFEGNILPSVFS